MVRNSKNPSFKFNFHLFCPCGHLMDYPLPNVDNCGHLVNHHLPHFVHVVIERPLITQSIVCATVDSHCLEYLEYLTLVRWKKPDVENKRTRTYFRDINLIQHWHGHGHGHGHWHLSKVSEGKVLCNLSHLLKKPTFPLNFMGTLCKKKELCHM